MSIDLLERLEVRRSVTPTELSDPGPSPALQNQLLKIASRVPDHGNLVPWRFITVIGDARRALAERLVSAQLKESLAPTSEQAQKLNSRLINVLTTPPLLVFVIYSPATSTKIPEIEQVLSTGAVCMNLINAAWAAGFASCWLTGWVASSPAARDIVGLSPTEQIAGYISIGTQRNASIDRSRPSLERIVTTWTADVRRTT